MSRKTPGQFSLGGVTSLVEGHFWIQNQSQDWWPPSSYVAVHVTSYKVLWSKFTCQFLAFKNNFDIFAFYLKHKSLNLKKPIKLLESPNYKCRFGKKTISTSDEFQTLSVFWFVFEKNVLICIHWNWRKLIWSSTHSLVYFIHSSINEANFSKNFKCASELLF